MRRIGRAGRFANLKTGDSATEVRECSHSVGVVVEVARQQVREERTRARSPAPLSDAAEPGAQQPLRYSGASER